MLQQVRTSQMTKKMNSTFTLKLYDSAKETKFPSQNLDLWVSHSVFEALRKQFNRDDTSPIYVNLKSAEVLKAFTIHTTLQALNPKSDFPQANVYISKDVKHPDWLMEDNTKVTITPVNEAELNTAEVVSIKLKKEEVKNWSEDEAGFAINNYKVHNRIAYKTQKLWVNPATKKPTLAEVTNVIPKPKKEFNTPLLVTESTKIIFEGLPEQQQTVIDFSKIGGLDEIINKLREIIQIPLQFPEVLKRFDIKPPKGLLLHGPPGNGKTMIARAVSYSMGAKFISIEGPELMSKYVGVAENQLREKFDEAEKLGDCVIFIDEIDAVAASREKATAEHTISIVSTLLNLMDGIKPRSRVFVVGATNRLNSVDPALRRPGRFDLEFEVPVPNLSARLDILSKYVDVSNKEITDKTVNESFLKILSEITNGYSGADIFSLYREAVMNSIRDELQFEAKTGKLFLKSKQEKIKLVQQHFLTAIKSITPTSLRGIDNNRNPVSWENLIAVDKQKDELGKLHQFVIKNPETHISNERPGFFNIIFKGNVGTGRKTLINSFASKFNYELLYIDLLNTASKPQQEAFADIEEIFTKAKQVAPSVIYILNVQYAASSEIFIRKILSESANFNLRNKVLLIAEIEGSQPIPKYLKGHKGFNKEIVFDSELSEKSLSEIYNKYGKAGGIITQSFETFSPAYKDKPIGQIISELNDLVLLNLKEEGG